LKTANRVVKTVKAAPAKEQDTYNVASCLPKMAEKRPYKRAVVFPYGRDSSGRVAYMHVTFSQLDRMSSRYAWGLNNLGIKKGSRVLLMVRPGIEFIGLTFALFRIGAVPVLIDPGMGPVRLLKCIQQVEPHAMIAVPLVHIIKSFRKKYFSSIKYSVTVGKKLFWDGITLEDIDLAEYKDYPPVKAGKEEKAAILFTTGSTGVPKGVLYLHGMFNAQVEYIKSYYKINEDDVDMPAFPLFALFSTAIGMTCVIPDMNPAKPAKVNPEKIIEAVQNHGVTTSFGSPAIWKRVGEYAEANNVKLPSIKRILMAGAPVPGYVLEKFRGILSDDADIFTPYGATEALPIVSISARERRGLEEKSAKGFGTCVGKPLPGTVIRIIAITDGKISSWSEAAILRGSEKGEIVVAGDVVTKEYFGMENKTALAKIYDGDTVWHRMGDIGYFDADGRIWFCGRKSHRVITDSETMFTVPCEAVFNEHPNVFRSALVGVGPKGGQTPVLIVEAHKKPLLSSAKRRLIRELLNIGSEFEHTKDIKHVLFYSSFPVDIRHNAKIFREKLAAWAEGKVAV